MSFASPSATKRLHRLGILAVAAMAVVAPLVAPSNAGAAPPAWSSEVFQAPTNLPPGGTGLIRILTANVGAAPATEPPSVSFVLPAGVSFQPPGPSSSWSCTGSPIVTCVSSIGGAESIEPFTYSSIGGSREAIVLPVAIAPEAPVGSSPFEVTLSGGGAPSVTQHHAISLGPERLGFGPTPGSFRTAILDADGSDYTEAGGHPYSTTISFRYNTRVVSLGGSPPLPAIQAEGSPRDIVADLPQGIVVDPIATPRCPNPGAVVQGECPPASQIGVLAASPSVASGGRLRMFAIYNLVPAKNHPAEFAFQTPVGIVTLVPRLRIGDGYGLSATVRNLTQIETLLSSSFTLWGVPADPRHDPQRCPSPNFLAQACVGYDEWGDPLYLSSSGFPSESGVDPKPFLTTPTSCSGNLASQLHLSQWEVDAPFDPTGAPDISSPGWKSAAAAGPAMRDCESLPFSPELTLRPTTPRPTSPSGLQAELRLPQNEDPDGRANAHLRNTTLILPQGMALNPGFADGLEACSEVQIGLTSTAGREARFDARKPSCPPASTIGATRIETPILDNPLTGAFYLASPWANPFESRLAAYLVAEGNGVVVKLAARIDADRDSGRVRIVLPNSPQLPVAKVSVELQGGPRAPFVTPGCGDYSGSAEVASWAAPETKLALQDRFLIQSGAMPGGCPDGALAPRFEAGLMGLRAGQSSPFVLNLSRDDGTGLIGGLEISLPEGLMASLKGIPACPEATLASASEDGAETLARRCSASRVGKIAVGAGAGSAPLFLDTGRVYLAGPYEGGRQSLMTVAPAVAGPFDLGSVLVRTAIYIDPDTARITLRSDPIPTMLDGIPLNLREIRLALDRPGFIRGPTDCTPATVEATVRGSDGASTRVKDRFQVADCVRLRFKPKLAVRLMGPTHRSAHPRLKAVFTSRPGEAGIERAVLTLPTTESLENAHIRGICELSRYRAGTCPANSIHGYARAWSPLLDKPLQAPIYLRSSRTRLPALAASLDGEVHLDLAVGLDAAHGRLRATLGSVPDVPLSRLALTLRGAKRGLLVNNTGLCEARPRIHASFEGQNGKLHLANRYVGIRCGKGG
jgi:hypothetical protein